MQSQDPDLGPDPKGRRHFIAAMKQNLSCSLMTPFREKMRRTDLRLYFKHTKSLGSCSDMTSSNQSIDLGKPRDAPVLQTVLVQGSQRGILPHRINSGVPLAPGTARTRLFKDANGSRGEAWLEGHVVLGEQRETPLCHHFSRSAQREESKRGTEGPDSECSAEAN